MKKYFWSLLAFAMVAMLSVSLSSCKNDDGIVEGATILGEWIHEDGVGDADVLVFTGNLTQGEVTYTEYDDDDYPEVRKSSFTFDPKTGNLSVPGFLPYRDAKVVTLTSSKLKLKYFPDDDDDTTFYRYEEYD